MRSVALLLALAGCSRAAVDAPSLLPRAVETSGDLTMTPPAAAPDAPPVDSATRALIDAQLVKARAADAAFRRALPAAIRPGPPRSEAWIAAQTALSAITIARAPVRDAAAALDAAVLKATDAGQDPAPIVAARGEIQALLDREDAELARVSR